MAGTQNQPLEYEQLSENSPDGSQWGRSSTEKLAFYGTTPTTIQTTSSAISTTAFTSTAPYGFATSTEALQVVWAVSSISAALRAYGLIV